MSYRVQLSAQAEDDIVRIFDWLSARSPDGAARWYGSFLGATEQLEHHPHSYPLAAEAEGFAEELRHVLFGTRRGRTYRALFDVR
jgi:plasmid stabilization system protein ParE